MSSLQARTFSRTAGTAVNYAARLELLEQNGSGAMRA